MKAIALISGGLDSILAARSIKEQGIGVIPLNFKIPFCHRDKEASRAADIKSLVSSSLGEELRFEDIRADFLKLVLNPRHGFGSNMNPCIDCKIFMLLKARELMDKWGAQFIVTGEVLGQRPMSQHRRALELIEKESGLEGLLLRPLCARVMPETVPEKEGWVKRDKLFNFSGRSRRPQRSLAREFNIENYPNAAGGCLLTDKHFSYRLKDLIGHDNLSLNDIELLKIGRHFRLGPKTKLIIGRDEAENKELEAKSSPGDYLFMPNEELAGPAGLGRGEFDDALIRLSCGILCAFCDLNGGKSARILYFHKGASVKNSEAIAFESAPIDKSRLTDLRI